MSERDSLPNSTLDSTHAPETKADRSASDATKDITQPELELTHPASEAADTTRNSESIPPDLDVVPRANYEPLGEIARGGLGRIYRAFDQRLGRVVAIKELLHARPGATARFLKEIELTVRLEHPNIVAIHEAGRWPNGEVFYAMNFVDGKTLLEEINAAQTKEQRLALLTNMLSVVDAIAFAHSEGLIHRDLKPANVLVGTFGETVVIDWGLAKEVHKKEVTAGERQPQLAPEGVDANLVPAGSTRPGAVVGTPPYMPPEQALGEAVDERADIYSLGAMLYQLLSGLTPYAEVQQAHLLAAIGKRPPIALSVLEPELAPDLLAIVNKAMAREPAQRYQNGSAMAEELRHFRDGRLVSAHSYTLGDLARRFLKRHRTAVLTAAVGSILLLFLASYGIETIRRERDTARRHASSATQAKERAQQRAEELIIVQAAALAQTDPTAAIVGLKQLKQERYGAFTIAALAQEKGVSTWVLAEKSGALTCTATAQQLIVTGDESALLRFWDKSHTPPRLLGTSEAHVDQLTACVFSPNGRQLATASRDGAIRLWDSVSLAATGPTRPPHELGNAKNAIKTLAFSPDGQQLVAATKTTTTLDALLHWNLTNGAQRTVAVRNTRAPGLSFSEDGLLLSGPHDGRMRVSDQGDTLALSPSELPPITAALWLDTSRILLGTQDGELLIWSHSDAPAQLQESKLDTLTKVAHLNKRITSLAHKPRSPSAPTISIDQLEGPLDSDWVAVATEGGGVHRLRLKTGELSELSRHKESISCLTVSPGGRFIASAGWDKEIQLVDLKAGTTRRLLGHRDRVTELHFIDAGSSLVSSSADGTLRAWDLADPLHEKRRVLRGHNVGAHSVDFSPDGRHLISGGHDNTLRLWDLQSGKSETLVGHEDHVFRTIFSPDGQLIASSSDDKTVRLWSVRDHTSRILRGHKADVEELAFSPDGKLLVSGAEDQTARVWDTQTGIAQVLTLNADPTQVLFSPKGDALVTADRSGIVSVFDAAQDNISRKFTFDGQGGEVWALAFGPSNQLVFSASRAGLVLRTNLDTEKSNVIGHVPGAQTLSVSPTGRNVAVAGLGGNMWLCSSAESAGPNGCQRLADSSSFIHSCAFSPNGKALYAASGDGQVRMWDLETHERRILLGHRAPVYSLAISGDGQWIATASADATIRVWPHIPHEKPGNLRQVLDSLNPSLPALSTQ